MNEAELITLVPVTKAPVEFTEKNPSTSKVVGVMTTLSTVLPTVIDKFEVRDLSIDTLFETDTELTNRVLKYNDELPISN